MAVLYLCALEAEAAPIKKFLSLKKEMKHHHFPLYTGEQKGEVHWLAVTGLGTVSAATVTSASIQMLMSQLDQEKSSDQLFVVNLGSAGHRDSRNIGKYFFARRIVDAATKRELLPELLWPGSRGSLTLESHPKPVHSSRALRNPDAMVDMEGFGFYAAASTFLLPEQIICIKVITDSLTPSQNTLTGISDHIQLSLRSIFEDLLRIQETVRSFTTPSVARDLSESLAKQFSLTVSQQSILQHSLEKYYLKHETFEGLTFTRDHSAHTTATERKVFFNKMLDELRS